MGAFKRGKARVRSWRLCAFEVHLPRSRHTCCLPFSAFIYECQGESAHPCLLLQHLKSPHTIFETGSPQFSGLLEDVRKLIPGSIKLALHLNASDAFCTKELTFPSKKTKFHPADSMKRLNASFCRTILSLGRQLHLYGRRVC